MIKVTYLGHSGFLAELEDVCLLFDYYKGELPEMDPDQKMAVFVSHSHYDHYRKDIFRLRDQFGQIRFILSDDVPAAEEEDVIFVRPNECREVLGLDITTLRSNDEGVAFLVKYKNKPENETVDMYVGKAAKVLKTVTKDGGRIYIFDEEWPAVSVNADDVFNEGENVKIIKTENMLMYVDGNDED